MQVTSLNVAQARQVMHEGINISTGIFKQPVQGALAVSVRGVEGDRQCDLINHGGEHKAVYAFSLQHYDYWRETLDNFDLAAGAFGENLTMSELDEARICIGDQLAIGGTLLEVSQPRVPCYKLGIALGDKRAPALFTRHFHTGVYFRVIEPGKITAGDRADRVHHHPAGISVHALFRAYFDRLCSGGEEILRAARELEELAPEWQEKLRRPRP